MVINHTKTKEWFNLAFNNLDRVIRNYKLRDYADCVFRIHLSTEQLQKSLLFLLGLQFRKTHEPSVIIESFLLKQDIDIEEDINKKLLKIAKLARTIEQEETKTRYGSIRKGKLIKPEEEYDKNRTDVFLKLLIEIMAKIMGLLKNLKDFNEECVEVQKYKNSIETVMNLDQE